MLIDGGSHFDAPAATQRRITALQGAAAWGHINTVILLLKKGANVNAPGAIKDGRTAIEAAAEHGRLDIVQLLLNAGAKGDARGHTGLKFAIELAEKEGFFAISKLLREHR